MKVRFETVDVFTNRPFGGNPLAVIPEADGLSTGQMQQIASEFNLSETTFVLPPKDPAHTAELRIFTPRAELPFAGHPNVGTAFVLARRGKSHGRSLKDKLVFEEQAGLVELEILREGSAVAGARLTAPKGYQRGGDLSVETIAAACSLSPDDVVTRSHRPCIAATGVSFVFAELRTRAALAAAAPRTDLFMEHVPAGEASGILLYTAADEEEVDVQARMFAPLHGIMEDPATGSANVILIQLLASLATERDVTIRKTIAQGVDMGRPSIMLAEAVKQHGEVTEARIGGMCVPMMEGTLGLD